MNVKGNHEFEVSKQQLWDYLMNPDVLAKITPGISKLKLIGEDEYQTESDIKIGPVKGLFKGKLKVVNKNEPNSFEIEMEQLSKIGNAHATIEMVLADAENKPSQLSFNGKAKLSGVIARTGQRVLSGVANAITKEVFSSLEDHISAEKVVTIEEDSPAIETENSKESLWTSFLSFLKNLLGK